MDFQAKFIAGACRTGSPELLFKPQRSIYENVRTLLYDFEIEDILETLNLFRPDAHPGCQKERDNEPDMEVRKEDVPM